MNPTLDRKSEILDLAEELLQSRGFSAFSYQDLADRLGIRKASIHHHFATKADLVLALSERYRAKAAEVAEALETQVSDPGVRFLALVEMTEQMHAEGQICPMGALGASFPLLPETVQNSVRSMAGEWNALVARLLEEARAAGVLDFPGSASDQALMVTAALQGGVQKGRVENSDHFHTVIQQLLKSMGRG